MKKTPTIFIVALFICSGILSAQPSLKFADIMIQKELNPSVTADARNLAGSLNLPVEIYVSGKAMVEAVSVENGKVVYSVITNFLHPFKDGYCAYYDDISKTFDLSKARQIYANGYCVDKTGEQLKFKTKKLYTKLYLVPCGTTSRRNVFAFDYDTGDLVDSAYVPYSNPILQTPRKVLQLSRTRILVADQLSDVVQMFDTSGTYIQVYAPLGGLNNAILDNIRDMEFRENGNLLVTNAGTTGNALNTVQQFSTTGAFLNTFIGTNINSPYCLLYRTGDLLVSNSGGTENIGKFNKTNGTYIGSYISNTLNFPQQMINLSGGRVAVCEFSGGLTGIRIYDSVGVIKDTLKGVTGNRGVWKLPNGNFLTTNSTGIYEIDDTTGALLRTIVAGLGFHSISVFDPNMITGVNEIKGEIPSGYNLYNNYPNPFNPSTNIKFEIPEKSFVNLTVYDVAGRRVEELVNSTMQTGIYNINWDAGDLRSGVYFARITAGGFSKTIKMMLLK
jgi:hypothetical protein